MVNGAGLAMTTMDLVKRAGGEPANFLDIGGGARADKVAAAMRLILADPKVDAILVNIFGGITRGDEVARGLIEARAQQERDVPMVVRIVGHERGGGRPAARGGPVRDRRRRSTRRPPRPSARARARQRARMSILVGRETRLLVQGITGREGEFHARAMLEYGTRIVAGVTPGKGGQTRARRRGPGVRHGRRGGPRDRRRHLLHLRPGRRRAGRGHGGRRRRHRDDLLHHRGIPALDMVPVVGSSGGAAPA